MNSPLRREDLDVVGNLFGIKFTDGGSWGLAHLYVEDDENWHWKLSVDRTWLYDLCEVAERAHEMNPNVNVSGEAKTSPPWKNQRKQ